MTGRQKTGPGKVNILIKHVTGIKRKKINGDTRSHYFVLQRNCDVEMKLMSMTNGPPLTSNLSPLQVCRDTMSPQLTQQLEYVLSKPLLKFQQKISNSPKHG